MQLKNHSLSLASDSGSGSDEVFCLLRVTNVPPSGFDWPVLMPCPGVPGPVKICGDSTKGDKVHSSVLDNRSELVTNKNRTSE